MKKKFVPTSTLEDKDRDQAEEEKYINRGRGWNMTGCGSAFVYPLLVIFLIVVFILLPICFIEC